MMTTSKKVHQRWFSVIILFLITFPFFAEDAKWVIGGTKLKYQTVQSKDTIVTNMAEIVPLEILSKLSTTIQRNVMPDEQFERDNYKLRTERQSLYLQISSEYKKRDAYVISNYSDLKMKSEIKASEKKIAELEKKLKTNLDSSKKKESETQSMMALLSPEDADDDFKKQSETELIKKLFKKIFTGSKELFTGEQVSFYRDNDGLFTPSEEIAAMEYTTSLYEKSVVNAGINALLTGNISYYGNYLSVSVDLYNYPGSKLLGSALEIGTMDDIDLITSSIARQLLPKIANALPVKLIVNINPAEAEKNTMIYIDDVLQKTEEKSLILDSGVHRIQFVSKGYQTAGTTYYFEGNQIYDIQIDFKEKKIGYIELGLRNNLDGKIYVNGEEADKTQIAINGKSLLGEFVTESGETSFFYVPEKLTYDSNFVTIKPKPMDRMSYIDTRRKWMYGTYTLFMSSLIPAFYTYGNYQNYLGLYKNKLVDYETAKNWQVASATCEVISIGLGVLWGIELVRYLIAANSVLPQNARQGKKDQLIIYNVENPDTVNPTDPENTTDTTNTTNTSDTGVDSDENVLQ